MSSSGAARSDVSGCGVCQTWLTVSKWETQSRSCAGLAQSLAVNHSPGSDGRVELKMSVSPSFDKVGCMSLHAELTVAPKFVGADQGPNSCAKAVSHGAIAATPAHTNATSRILNRTSFPMLFIIILLCYL